VYLCLCKGVSDRAVWEAGRAGHTTAKALIAVLGLDDEECCGRCATEPEAFLEVARRGAGEGCRVPVGAG
jgi:bacterioferritin-associated ferredoxin